MKPTEGSHTGETLGQDMLEETTKKFLRIELDLVGFAGVAVDERPDQLGVGK
jgi:hypothetical protein